MKNFKLFFILFLLSAKVAGQNVITIKSDAFKPKHLHADIDYAFKKFEQIHPDFFKEIPRDSALNRFENLKKKHYHTINSI